TITDAGDSVAQASDVVTVTARNVAPTVALAGAASANEGAAYTLTLGAITDPGADTVSQILVRWGDGTTDTVFRPGPVTHVFANGNASRTVQVDLVDEDGTYAGVASKAVSVLNVLPSFDLGPAVNTQEGAAVLFAPVI